MRSDRSKQDFSYSNILIHPLFHSHSVFNISLAHFSPKPHCHLFYRLHSLEATMYTSLVTSLTLATAAFAAPLQPRQFTYQQTNPFGIYAVSAEESSEYDGYALVNAHVGAGQNALQLLDPTSQGPADLAYLNGTQQDFYSDSTRVVFNITGANSAFEIRLPDAKTGSVGQVFSEPGEGTASFSIGAENYLETAGGSSAGT